MSAVTCEMDGPYVGNRASIVSFSIARRWLAMDMATREAAEMAGAVPLSASIRLGGNGQDKQPEYFVPIGVALALAVVGDHGDPHDPAAIRAMEARVVGSIESLSELDRISKGE